MIHASMDGENKENLRRLDHDRDPNNLEWIVTFGSIWLEISHNFHSPECLAIFNFPLILPFSEKQQTAQIEKLKIFLY